MSDFAGTYAGVANPRTMFVEGPFGAGKTTFAIETLYAWLEAGIPPSRILVMIPQRTMALHYQLALQDAAHGPMGSVDIRTLGGLAKDVCNLYWPVAAQECGFTRPENPPRFLTIETSQYAMSEFVRAAVERGEFDAVSISPQQIARQIVDNLTKAAIMRIDYHHVPTLLADGWGEERPRKRLLAYEAGGRVAEEYRRYCLDNNLLDFPLQLEMFSHLMNKPDFREQFFNSRTHLIVEHLQEETALSHDLIYEWLPRLEGALLTYEWDSGYRIFLGASPEGAEFLRQHCEGILTLNRSFITSPGLNGLEDEVAYSFGKSWARPAPDDGPPLAFSYAFHSYFPQMLDWTADTIKKLVDEDGIEPRDIVVLAPYLSDALRFSLGRKLEARGIPSVSHRPSRALRDEPAARCLLTLVALAHPAWGYQPPLEDVAQAFQLAIDGLDPVRARLLARVVYRPGKAPHLATFEQMIPDMQARITYLAGGRYETLRKWLIEYGENETAPLDHVFSRLFGEVLSQPGSGFHNDPEAGRITAELVDSARSFRRSLFDSDADLNEIGRRYFTIVNQGLLAGLYVQSWRDEMANAVFMAPAYTFLMRNRSAEVQFWLDVGSIGWWERLDQPLTHPYVLSKNWPPGQIWSDGDEYTRQQDMLFRIMTGLIRRTRQHVYLGISDLGESGFEQRGPLLRVFQSILRRHPQPDLGAAAYE
jgi:hypothetical protein